MPKITFVQPDGSRVEVEGDLGRSVMLAARGADVLGIIADCGGGATCGTCHVRIDPDWLERVPPPADAETAMIECVIDPNERSRLSCQIEVTDALDGLVVEVPVRQI